jgi:hypothetical protein
VAFLRQIVLITNQVCHHFQPSGNFLHQIQGQVYEFGENSRETDAHHQRTLPGFNVDVTSSSLHGVQNEVIDERPDFDLCLRANRLKVAGGLIHGFCVVVRTHLVGRTGCVTKNLNALWNDQRWISKTV